MKGDDDGFIVTLSSGKFLFYFLSFCSMNLSLFIYVIFRVMKKNFLIRSSSIVCFVISVILFLRWPLGTLHKHSDVYCSIQALILNYCFISTHAHFAFVMWNNLVTAMGWKILGIKDPSALVGLMFFVSIATPIVPTIIILAISLDPTLIGTSKKSAKQIFLKKYFFCAVQEPSWWGYRLWFILFSFPGIVAACILFVKTIQSRRKMLQFSNTSQFSKKQLTRMFLAIITYMVLSILSVAFGFTEPKNPNMIHLSDFFPASVGFLIFITYGFGSTAIQFYKKMYVKMGRRMGIDVKDFSSRDSRKDSKSSITTRRQSSLKSIESRSRRLSQLSESIDEQFIYDIPNINKEEYEKRTVTRQVMKRNQIRRVSEPSNKRSSSLNINAKSIDIIPEGNESSEEFGDDLL